MRSAQLAHAAGWGNQHLPLLQVSNLFVQMPWLAPFVSYCDLLAIVHAGSVL